MSIKVELKDIKRGLRAFEIKSLALIKLAVNATSLELQSEAKELAPVKTGNLRSSIQGQSMELGMVKEVGSKVKYAKKVHETHKTNSKFLTEPLVGAEQRLMQRLSKIV